MYRHKIISISVILLITCITAIALTRLPLLEFNYDFESYFPTGDDDLKLYLDFRNEFETDNDFVLIGLFNKEGIFQVPFLNENIH